MLQPGAAAPSVTLQTLDGQAFPLNQAWRSGQQALLIFLRHLGWLPCREHVAQLRPYYPQIQVLNADVFVISFGTEAGAWRWLEETGAPFTILLDPQRAAYQAYRLEHSLLRSWGLTVIRRYARLLLSGRRWRGIQGDSGQLGGDFIVDRHGIVRLSHPSHDPTDRPSAPMLLSVLSNLAAG